MDNKIKIIIKILVITIVILMVIITVSCIRHSNGTSLTTSNSITPSTSAVVKASPTQSGAYYTSVQNKNIGLSPQKVDSNESPVRSPWWGVLIGVVTGFIIGFGLRLCIWIGHLTARSKHRHEYFKKIKKYFKIESLSPRANKAIRVILFVIFGACVILVFVNTEKSMWSVICIGIIFGFTLYSLLLDSKFVKAIIRVTNSIIHSVSSWARNFGEEFGVWMIILGFVILVFSLIFGVIHVNITELVSLGLALVFGGIGFIAVYIGEQSDKRMITMSELEFDEKMAINSEYVAKIANDPFSVDTRRIYYDVRSICRLVNWLQPEDITQLFVVISEMIKIVNELDRSTVGSKWTESGYLKLLYQLTGMSNHIKATCKLTTIRVSIQRVIDNSSNYQTSTDHFIVKISGPSYPSGIKKGIGFSNNHGPFYWELIGIMPGQYEIISTEVHWEIVTERNIQVETDKENRVSVVAKFIPN